MYTYVCANICILYECVFIRAPRHTSHLVVSTCVCTSMYVRMSFVVSTCVCLEEHTHIHIGGTAPSRHTSSVTWRRIGGTAALGQCRLRTVWRRCATYTCHLRVCALRRVNTVRITVAPQCHLHACVKMHVCMFVHIYTSLCTYIHRIYLHVFMYIDTYTRH